MLGTWRTHKEYQSYLEEKMIPYFVEDSENVKQYESALSKLTYLISIHSNPCFHSIIHLQVLRQKTSRNSFVHSSLCLNSEPTASLNGSIN